LAHSRSPLTITRYAVNALGAACPVLRAPPPSSVTFDAAREDGAVFIACDKKSSCSNGLRGGPALFHRRFCATANCTRGPIPGDPSPLKCSRRKPWAARGPRWICVRGFDNRAMMMVSTFTSESPLAHIRARASSLPRFSSIPLVRRVPLTPAGDSRGESTDQDLVRPAAVSGAAAWSDRPARARIRFPCPAERLDGQAAPLADGAIIKESPKRARRFRLFRLFSHDEDPGGRADERAPSHRARRGRCHQVLALPFAVNEGDN